MCMLDNGDGMVTMLSQAEPVARKAHKCKECGREIAPGERYHVDRFIWEGELNTHKVCAHCMVAREWLSDECGGWLFGVVAMVGGKNKTAIRNATPPEFRDILLALARRCQVRPNVRAKRGQTAEKEHEDEQN